jgi:hypothetical protein
VKEKRKWTFASENGVEGDVGCEEAAFDRHLHFAAAPVEVAEEALGKQREVRGGGGGGATRHGQRGHSDIREHE